MQMQPSMIQGLCSHYTPQSTLCNWRLSRDFKKLNNLIFHRYLTESLELLEQWGFWGESALYFIKFTQCEGEV